MSHEFYLSARNQALKEVEKLIQKEEKSFTFPEGITEFIDDIYEMKLGEINSNLEDITIEEIFYQGLDVSGGGIRYPKDIDRLKQALSAFDSYCFSCLGDELFACLLTSDGDLIIKENSFEANGKFSYFNNKYLNITGNFDKNEKELREIFDFIFEFNDGGYDLNVSHYYGE